MSVEFSVSYTRKEYISILSDHVREIATAKQLEKHPGVPVTSKFPMSIAFVHVMGSIAFYFKTRKMPLCEFKFDEERITRKTDLGILETDWTEIVKISEYTDGMIIFKGKGGLPIPYRCITEQEKQWILERHKTVNTNNSRY